MPDSPEYKSEVLERWQHMFDDLKEWFKIADNRANGVISINSMLLGFVTISTFVNLGSPKNDISTVGQILLFSFFIKIPKVHARVNFGATLFNRAYVGKVRRHIQNDRRV